jgi:hypothetical protein
VVRRATITLKKFHTQTRKPEVWPDHVLVTNARLQVLSVRPPVSADQWEDEGLTAPKALSTISNARDSVRAGAVPKAVEEEDEHAAPPRKVSKAPTSDAASRRQPPVAKGEEE